MSHDPVNHPAHYTSSPARCECGKPIECIQITQHMGFILGNALKYIWRCDLKRDAIEDLEKARWYLDREIEKRKSNRLVRSIQQLEEGRGVERELIESGASPEYPQRNFGVNGSGWDVIGD